MSFSRDEIFESLAEDMMTPSRTRSHVEFTSRITRKFDGYSVVRRKGRGLPDFTPDWRTRGRSTLERLKLNKRPRVAKVLSDFLLWVS